MRKAQIFYLRKAYRKQKDAYWSYLDTRPLLEKLGNCGVRREAEG